MTRLLRVPTLALLGLLLGASPAIPPATPPAIPPTRPTTMSSPPASVPSVTVLSYRCPKATTAPVLDGRGDDPAWARAPWTADFVDIEGALKPAPAHRTRVKMLWDEDHLYVLAELEEPHITASLTERNALIYHDNDFEVFIDPDGDRKRYYEFEVNALGTVMELTLPKTYRDGGHYTFVKTPGLRWAVHLDGTLNDPRDTDRKWSIEVAIPLAGLRHHDVGGVPERLAAGQSWRINFSRVQWEHRIVEGKYIKTPKSQRPEDNWVWSPQGVIDMHRPETWGRLEFIE